MSGLKLEREFTADPVTVFDFVTKAENLGKWWGPEGMSLMDAALDFTKPGPWKSTLVNAEGSRYKVSGVVTAVEPEKSVAFTWGWHDEEDARGHESNVRFEVKSNGAGGTIFSLIHEGLADEPSAQNHSEGWTSTLKKLERMAN